VKPRTPRNEWQRLQYATRNSLKGYQRVWQDEAAFRFQTLVLVVATPVAFWLAQSWLQFGLLLAFWIAAMAAELGNSAIEATVDRIGPEMHELSGKAKDAGSAMVMTLMMLAGLIWILVILDRFG